MNPTLLELRKFVIPEIISCSKSQFDPQLVKIFVEIIKKHLKSPKKEALIYPGENLNN